MSCMFLSLLQDCGEIIAQTSTLVYLGLSKGNFDGILISSILTAKCFGLDGFSQNILAVKGIDDNTAAPNTTRVIILLDTSLPIILIFF